MNRAVFKQSVELFSKALELDPDYALAYTGLSAAHLFDYQNRWSDRSDQSLRVAKHNIELAIETDPREPLARVIASRVATFEADFDRAKSEAQDALTVGSLS
jgi:adenylate cyclase